MLKNCWNLIKKNKAVTVVILIAVVVFGLYFFNFHNGISDDNGKWGTFGDYIGGILNPIIAGFAFYLIAKSYNLQKKELEETRKLLRISTDAQEKQVKVAALTALINLNFTKINMLDNQINSLRQGKLSESKTQKSEEDARRQAIHEIKLDRDIKFKQDVINNRLKDINSEIEKLQKENFCLEEKIRILIENKRDVE